MAFSLYSERPIVAAYPHGFFGSVQAWLANAAIARKRRTTLAALLELEDFRLDDLGITRSDVVMALRDPNRSAGRQLAFKRSVRASL